MKDVNNEGREADAVCSFINVEMKLLSKITTTYMILLSYDWMHALESVTRWHAVYYNTRMSDNSESGSDDGAVGTARICFA